MKTGKVWGVTELMLRTPLIEVHRLTIQPHMQCSMHKHQFKWNAFYVKSGRLMIDVRKNNYDLIDRTELEAGEFMTVQPGEFHRFVTDEIGCDGIEIYYPETLSEDIIRETVGGAVK